MFTWQTWIALTEPINIVLFVLLVILQEPRETEATNDQFQA